MSLSCEQGRPSTTHNAIDQRIRARYIGHHAPLAFEQIEKDIARERIGETNLLVLKETEPLELLHFGGINRDAHVVRELQLHAVALSKDHMFNKITNRKTKKPINTLR